MIELLELVDRPQTLGFQADMAHTLLYTIGYNAPEDALLSPKFDWKDQEKLREALATMTNASCVPGRSISTWPKTMAR